MLKCGIISFLLKIIAAFSWTHLEVRGQDQAAPGALFLCLSSTYLDCVGNYTCSTFSWCLTFSLDASTRWIRWRVQAKPADCDALAGIDVYLTFKVAFNWWSQFGQKSNQAHSCGLLRGPSLIHRADSGDACISVWSPFPKAKRNRRAGENSLWQKIESHWIIFH